VQHAGITEETAFQEPVLEKDKFSCALWMSSWFTDCKVLTCIREVFMMLGEVALGLQPVTLLLRKDS